MFCVNCGNKLEEEWKVCPECGTEVIKQKEEKKIGTQGKRVCEKCGNELQDDWVKCPFCGHTEQEENLQQDVKQNSSIKEFEFEGFRRTGRFGFQYITSNIKVDGEHINVVVHKKKEQNITFTRQNILDIKFPILPVIGAMDIVRIILFIILAIPLRGMSIFAVLFFAKITLVKHMQIKLRDGRKIAVPIRQKAESVEFLENIAYSESEILKIAASAVSSSRIMIAEWIISTLMLILAAATIGIGVQNYTNKQNANVISQNKQDDTVRSLQEVGGYEAWVESEYASKVRADIVVMLPVTQRETDTYAVKICTDLGDIIYIKQADGSLATEWEWLMNAVPDIEGGDTATFQATLTIDGYAVIEGEESIPIFVAEDIEAYVNQQKNEDEVQESVNLSYDLFKDAENNLLYSNEQGQIIDPNGNVISEYLGYSITDNGYIYDKEGDHCLEGIMVDEKGKLFIFVPSETTTEVNYIDSLIHDFGYINNNNQRRIYFTHREGDALYFGIYDSQDIDILRNCPAEIVDSSTLRYNQPDYGYDLTITILDQYSFSVTGTIDDEYTTGIYYIASN